ncbi:MAG: hypothetical protein HC838_01880 [Spirulinaceae cyanobacterium RM2_2_10]|nr:hypothetical protein [Spirulinaceae cyanobacterium SM2_1_0]NJO19058.1 hypothetical protein [Spirulinaceae cyanobacterium RM2_2_10]
MPRLNLGSVDLGDHDHDWLVVMTRLSGRSVRQNVSALLEHHVRSRKNEYEAMLKYTARKHGMTEQECFYRLLNNFELGPPVNDFAELPPTLPSDE